MSEPDFLPPNRPLPPEVRAAARRRVDARTHSGRSVVTALAVAVAVLVVPALGAIGFASLRPAPQSTVADPTVPRLFVSPAKLYSVRDGAPQDAADRCRKDGMTGEPIVTASARGAMVIAFRDGDGTRFCELTPASVAVTPAAAAPPPGQGEIVLSTLNGTVAGVVDESVTEVSVRDASLPSPTTDHGEPAAVRGGVFLLPNSISANPADLGLWVGGTAVSVPAAALPARVPAKTDRPQPKADRSSAAGKALARCITEDPRPPLVDPDAWQPAAAATLTAGERVQLARYGDLLAVCVFRGAPGSPGTAGLTVDDGTMSNGVRDAEADGNPWLFTRTVFYGFASSPGGGSSSDTVAVTGLVTDSRVASVSISRPSRDPVVATVTGGTFVLPGIGLNEESPGTTNDRSTITAYDDGGRVLGTTTIAT